MVKEITPVCSYLEISKIVSFLKENFPSFDSNFISLIAIYCAGISWDDVKTYRSNTYLIDALQVKKLPSVEVDQQTQATIHRRAKQTLDILRKKNIIRSEQGLLSGEQKAFLSDKGYLVIPDVLTPKEVSQLHELTLHIAAEEERAGVAYNYGEGNLQRVFNLLAKHPVYAEVIQIPLLQEILDFYFGKDTFHEKCVLSSFQANLLFPGAEAQKLHVDGFGSSEPLPPWPSRLNVNFLLTDWTEENGATHLVPESHKLHQSPPPWDPQDSSLCKVLAPKGSLAIWTGHTWHKSGKNSSDDVRFGLFACFSPSHIKELCTEEEHHLVLEKEIADTFSPELRFMVGYDRGVKRGALHRVNFEDTKFKELSITKNGN